MSEPNIDRELAALETALAGLKPAAPLDRDRLMFSAGQASLPRRGWGWPAATAALLLVSFALAGMLLNRPALQEIVRVVPVPVAVPIAVPVDARAPGVQPGMPSSLPSVEALSPVARVNPAGASLEYAQLRKEVLRWGVDALSSRPPMVAVSRPASTVGSLLHEIEQ
jgi:hypothetical protein